MSGLTAGWLVITTSLNILPGPDLYITPIASKWFSLLIQYRKLSLCRKKQVKAFHLFPFSKY